MHVIAETLVPVLGVLAVGFVLGRRRRHAQGLAALALGVAAPALLFGLFADMRAGDGPWASLVLGVVCMVAVTGLLGRAVLPLLSAPHRGVLLPVMFWNAGNMGLSITRLRFGEEWLPAAAVVFATITALNAVVGTWIAAGGGPARGLVEVARMPLTWAIAAGLGCAVTGLALPTMLREPVDMLGSMAIPFMLLTLGLSLATLKLTRLRDAALLVACRMGGGYLAARLYIALAEPPEMVGQLLLVESVLPPAVITVLFARRFDAGTETVASTIVLGTLASFVVLPLVL